MILKILGCGTSTGVPIPGCSCAVCTSGDPKNIRFKTSALLSSDDGKHHVLIDASTDFRHQALRYQIPSLDAVLFTHSHADHILGVDDLRSYNFIRGGAIPCYGSEETLGEVARVFRYIFEGNPAYEGGPLPQLVLHPIHYGEKFNTSIFTILPFEVLHGSMSVTGFRIGNLAYVTDCKYVPQASASLLSGLDVLILDGLRYEPHNTHMTIDEAIAFASEIGAGQTYLTHMTHSVDYHEVSRKLPSHVALAWDGLEIQTG